MTKHQAFKEAWENYPSQDNEGYVPDRGGFKSGFLCAWDQQQTKIDALQAEVAGLKRALEDREAVCEQHIQNIEAQRMRARVRMPKLGASLREEVVSLKIQLSQAERYASNQRMRILRFKEALDRECYCKHLSHTGPCNVCRVKQELSPDKYQSAENKK